MSHIDLVSLLIQSSIIAALPLIIAGLGELVSERAGVMNLGVEGMMLTGAAIAFFTMVKTGSLMLSLAVGACAGLVLSSVFAYCTLTLLASQVPAGMAITALGVGMSSYIGKSLAGASVPSAAPFSVPFLDQIPLLGKALFSLPPMAYLALLGCFAVRWFLHSTRSGLALNAVGDSPTTAFQLGYGVTRIRYAAVMFGGAMAGLAGAYYCIGYVLLWQDQMTAGRGWMAIALVVFAGWNPWRLMFGALLFGATTAIQFQAQAAGVQVPSQLLASVPYLTTIAVLTYIAARKNKISTMPRALGKTFHPLLSKLV